MKHDEVSINRTMFETFKNRLEFDSLDYHAVLYSDERGYEYNFKTHKIRPFTSVLWFDINSEDFDIFANYFEEKCIAAIAKFEADGNSSEAVPSCIGYLDNKYIVVDIDSLGHIISSDSDYIRSNGINHSVLKKSFDGFFDHITMLYDRNEEFFISMINKNFDLI